MDLCDTSVLTGLWGCCKLWTLQDVEARLPWFLFQFLQHKPWVSRLANLPSGGQFRPVQLRQVATSDTKLAPPLSVPVCKSTLGSGRWSCRGLWLCPGSGSPCGAQGECSAAAPYAPACPAIRVWRGRGRRGRRWHHQIGWERWETSGHCWKQWTGEVTETEIPHSGDHLPTKGPFILQITWQTWHQFNSTVGIHIKELKGLKRIANAQMSCIQNEKNNLKKIFIFCDLHQKVECTHKAWQKWSLCRVLLNITENKSIQAFAKEGTVSLVCLR